MKKFALALLVSAVTINFCFAQQYLDITPGNGYGLRFWASDGYKIHMGNSSEYLYGPVTDYSIKTNMYNSTGGRGWTWGIAGATPVVGINTLGNMQIAGTFQSGKIVAAGSTSSEETILNATNMADQDFQVKISAAGAATKRTIIGPSTTGRFSLGVNGNEYLTVVNGGNVGIGTTSPAFSLDVQGFGTRVKNTSTASGAYTTLRLQGPDYANGLELDFFGNNNISSDLNWSYGGGPGSVALININPKPLTFATNNIGRMIIDGNGNVGIGTFNPGSYKLAVEGKIGAREVNVIATNPWPDYVFHKDYKLSSLDEIKNYIDQNKHLPEMPSAQEVEKNGVNLGEMNALLLKKIEELTLHTIEMNKKFEKMQNEIDQLKSAKK